MKEAGAKMAVMLKVSAPFHSIMMEPAAVKLKEVLDTVTIQDAQMPVYANYNAAAEIKADDIRKNLVLQAAHPVLWDASIQQMIADGADLMIEAGPGTVLSGFMKRINRRIRTLHAEDVETVTNVLNTWEE